MSQHRTKIVGSKYENGAFCVLIECCGEHQQWHTVAPGRADKGFDAQHSITALAHAKVLESKPLVEAKVGEEKLHEV